MWEGRKEGGARHRHVPVSQPWGPGQNLRGCLPPSLQPLEAHCSFSPQPAALQHRPAWRGARGRGVQGQPGGGQAPCVLSPGPMGSCRPAGQTLSKEECELSLHLGAFHLTPPSSAPCCSSPFLPSLHYLLPPPRAQVSADPAYSPPSSREQGAPARLRCPILLHLLLQPQSAMPGPGPRTATSCLLELSCARPLAQAHPMQWKPPAPTESKHCSPRHPPFFSSAGWLEPPWDILPAD